MQPECLKDTVLRVFRVGRTKSQKNTQKKVMRVHYYRTWKYGLAVHTLKALEVKVSVRMIMCLLKQYTGATLLFTEA